MASSSSKNDAKESANSVSVSPMDAQNSQHIQRSSPSSPSPSDAMMDESSGMCGPSPSSPELDQSKDRSSQTSDAVATVNKPNNINNEKTPERVHPWNSPPTVESRRDAALREEYVRKQMTSLLTKFHKEKDAAAKRHARVQLEEARREFAKLTAWGAIADFHLGAASGQHSVSLYRAFASSLPSRGAEIVNQFRDGAECELLFDTESQEFFIFDRVIAHVEDDREPRTVSTASGPQRAAGGPSNSETVVIKVLGKSPENLEIDPLRYSREFIIHSSVSKFGHRNILPLYRYYDTPTHCFAVMPFADASLLDAVRDRFRYTRRGFDEHAVQGVAAQMLASVEFLANLGIAHRDISLENFCLSTRTGDILLLDFGLAMPLKLTSLHSGQWEQVPSSFTGKLNYMAPEIFHHTPGANSTLDPIASDIWSLGICFFVLLTGNFPFDQPGPGCQRFQLRGRKGIAAVMRNLISKGRLSSDLRVSELFLDLLNRMLQGDPRDRITLSQLKAHPFFLNRA
mmetsp:Transcript_13824/g.26848  ORF Transcript_13824/g.26848 Transcript_13824/m.26848 type:complete len:514 (+) Transcript_13824:2038-3579(+)|eukprot:CAMPEP_0171539444 /NCGR_PEP_ID=MMETSP0960-20121227/611_1 /TAXON_ID=87120 /ORGANISM="Aurantiochytrium limacinum, Strain ATCCMYA-1381" /LENGTH=513 /DNA_ID=CAMNT_0012086467 /DNA_START=1985 /DNA_END=3522 /DNA_ORIENTATION=+